MTTQLAMIALKSGDSVDWDEAAEQVRGNPKAAALLKREYRSPWIHPGKGQALLARPASVRNAGPRLLLPPSGTDSARGGIMKRLLLLLPAALALAPTAGAAEGPVQVSLGYSFVKYLETDAGSAPVGAFLAISGRKNLTLELDLGWQRDSEELFGESFTLNTFTAVAGPKVSFATGGVVRPFVHVLGGLRYDTANGESNTSWGGVAGGGVDIRAGNRVSVRLGADFQIFFDQGDNLKTLRLGVGLTF